LKKAGRKEKKKKLTIASIVGIVIGSTLMALGLYHALVHGRPGAYFVVFLGAVFNGVIVWSYRS